MNFCLQTDNVSVKMGFHGTCHGPCLIPCHERLVDFPIYLHLELVEILGRLLHPEDETSNETRHLCNVPTLNLNSL